MVRGAWGYEQPWARERNLFTGAPQGVRLKEGRIRDMRPDWEKVVRRMELLQMRKSFLVAFKMLEKKERNWSRRVCK